MNLTQYDYKTKWFKALRPFYRDETNDFNTLFSCIDEDEYRLNKLPEAGVAIDLGAHIGGVTLALASKGYKVTAVEMFKENADLLRKNIEVNNFNDGRITIYEGAVVGKRTKAVTAYYADPSVPSGQAHHYIGTTLPDKFIAGTDKHGAKVKVPAFALEDILAEIPVCDFMKIDIEGAEWEVIKNTPADVLKKVKRIAVEIEGLDGEVSTTDFLKLLPKGFKDVSKEYFPQWCKPGRIIHGYYINEQ